MPIPSDLVANSNLEYQKIFDQCENGLLKKYFFDFHNACSLFLSPRIMLVALICCIWNLFSFFLSYRQCPELLYGNKSRIMYNAIILPWLLMVYHVLHYIAWKVGQDYNKRRITGERIFNVLIGLLESYNMSHTIFEKPRKRFSAFFYIFWLVLLSTAFYVLVAVILVLSIEDSTCDYVYAMSTVFYLPIFVVLSVSGSSVVFFIITLKKSSIMIRGLLLNWIDRYESLKRTPISNLALLLRQQCSKDDEIAVHINPNEMEEIDHSTEFSSVSTPLDLNESKDFSSNQVRMRTIELKPIQQSLNSALSPVQGPSSSETLPRSSRERSIEIHNRLTFNGRPFAFGYLESPDEKPSSLLQKKGATVVNPLTEINDLSLTSGFDRSQALWIAVCLFTKMTSDKQGTNDSSFATLHDIANAESLNDQSWIWDIDDCTDFPPMSSKTQSPIWWNSNRLEIASSYLQQLIRRDAYERYLWICDLCRDLSVCWSLSIVGLTSSSLIVFFWYLYTAIFVLNFHRLSNTLIWILASCLIFFMPLNHLVVANIAMDDIIEKFRLTMPMSNLYSALGESSTRDYAKSSRQTSSDSFLGSISLSSPLMYNIPTRLKWVTSMFPMTSSQDYAVIGGREEWLSFFSCNPVQWTVFGLAITPNIVKTLTIGAITSIGVTVLPSIAASMMYSNKH